MLEKSKSRIYKIINKATRGDSASELFDYFLFTLIILNVVAVIFETVDSIYQKHYVLFVAFETFSIVVFTLEYILRIWTCTIDKKYRHPIVGRLKASVSPLALIDLMVILPFYLSFILPCDLRFLRLIRVFPLLLLRKVGKYSDSLETFSEVLRDKKEELLTAFLTAVVILTLSSSAVYFVENSAQPNMFSSIPATMWWGVVTMTTLGYGDMYPVTVLGKVLASIVVCTGITTYAIPLGIISSGFVEEMEKKRGLIEKRKEVKNCPHCGKKV